MKNLKNIIETTYDNISDIQEKNIKFIKQVIELLDNGKIRISEKIDNKWITHQWIKKAILLFFKINDNKIIDNRYFDKIPIKFANYDKKKFQKLQCRIVPPATLRYGSYISKNTVIMPSYINIGSYIGEGSMIDTWATIGSCAQIGKNVHISGGVGIGGVLEPIQSNPTIIEDNCFIGARSEIVEGVIIEKNSVISMGVYIGQSTKIYDRDTNKIFYGRVPSGSVVVSGNLPSKNGFYSLYCAVIVKKVDEKTLKKIGINNLLHDID